MALYLLLEPSLGSQAPVFGHLGACAGLAVLMIALFLTHAKLPDDTSSPGEAPHKDETLIVGDSLTEGFGSLDGAAVDNVASNPNTRPSRRDGSA